MASSASKPTSSTRSRKGKATRRSKTTKSKAGAGSAVPKAMTIPELKTAFDAVNHETEALLRAGLPQAELVKRFQALWKSVFHRPVTSEAAAAYLAIRRGAKTYKTRKQRGGAAAPLAGAPLDYITRPGVDGVYGSFPAYVAQGQAFYNTVNQPAIAQDCGVVDTTPKVPVSIGSNEVMSAAKQAGGALSDVGVAKQAGGALSDVARLAMSRPVGPNVPPSVAQESQDYFLGRPLSASPDPSSSKLTLF